MDPRRTSDPSVTHRWQAATSARLCCAHVERKVAFYQGFVGLAGVEPATSALSGLDKRLVRQLVAFDLPAHATKSRLVPLRMGTLGARHKVDMTVQVRAFRC